MTIVKCKNCGRLIHYSSKCFLCGSTEGFVRMSDAKVHENAENAFLTAQKLISAGRFAEGEAAVSEVLKWSPNSSEAHWLRLLARAGCRNDGELVMNGVCLDDMSDFDTSCMFANDAEKHVYKTVGAVSANLRAALRNMIKAKYLSDKNRLDISGKLNELDGFIRPKRAALMDAWGRLRQYEQQLKLLESEGAIHIAEHRRTLLDARASAAKIRSEIENKPEITEKEYFSYKTNIEMISGMSIASVNNIEKLRAEHPSVASAADITAKRDELEHSIAAMMAEIKKYEQQTEALIAQICSVNAAEEKLLGLADEGNYTELKQVLGENNFERAVQYACAGK